MAGQSISMMAKATNEMSVCELERQYSDLKIDENSKVSKVGLDSEDPKNLISQLCNHFYYLGWVSGTGGGLSIRQNGRIYCSPSRILKECINPNDVFVLNEGSDILEGAANTTLKCSDCLSLFLIPFKLRNAGCCIHGHSINANLASNLYQKKRSLVMVKKQASDTILDRGRFKEFRISNQEMIKGIKKGSSDEYHQNIDTLIVPIIDNVLHEPELASTFCEALDKYPKTNAVLIENHGVFVWGETWQQAKAMAECYDYLFGLKLEAIKCGLSLISED